MRSRANFAIQSVFSQFEERIGGTYSVLEGYSQISSPRASALRWVDLGGSVSNHREFGVGVAAEMDDCISGRYESSQQNLGCRPQNLVARYVSTGHPTKTIF